MNNVNLSANTLFHYTSDIERLKSIIVNGLYPRYCQEAVLGSSRFGYPTAEVCLPMISFCDIPLSQARTHMTKYGNYAIGLTKDWGLKKGVAPVLYYHKDSRSHDAFLRICDLVGRLKGANDDLFLNLTDLGYFFKRYEGDSAKDGQFTRFYDEREWRYIPPPAQARPGLFMDTSDFSNHAKRDKNNKRLEEFRLTFEPSDVRYVVVSEENDIYDMIEHIQRENGRYSHKDVMLLTTKIITAKQILDDF